MKPRTKVLGGVLGISLLLVGGAVIWQWDTIEAIIQWKQYSNEELAVQIDEQKTKVKQSLKDYGIEGLVDFTHEEEEAIRKGDLSVEAALEQLKETTAAEVEHQVKETLENNGPGGTSEKSEQAQSLEKDKTPASAKPDQKKSQRIIQQAALEMYEIKAIYLGKLGQLERKALEDYRALSKEERTKGGLAKLASKYMQPGLSLVSSCDQEVAKVLVGLKKDLEAIGASTDIVGIMNEAYEEEKGLKKAYYLSLI